LPARLGDVARAFLAGRAFGVSRLAVLGSVVVERLADGVFILGLVVVLGLTVAGTGSLAPTVVVHLVVTLPVALTGLVCAWLLHFRVADITHEGAPAAIEGADEDMSAAAPIGG